jgi:hypothetical protein
MDRKKLSRTPQCNFGEVVLFVLALWTFLLVLNDEWLWNLAGCRLDQSWGSWPLASPQIRHPFAQYVRENDGIRTLILFPRGLRSGNRLVCTFQNVLTYFSNCTTNKISIKEKILMQLHRYSQQHIRLWTEQNSTLWTLCHSYFKDISANIELQMYSLTCCWPYM